MHFAVHIRVEIPDDSADLEGLSSRGAAQLVLAELDAVLRIHGPDGEVVLVHEVRCLAHERGLAIDAVAEAPSARAAATGLTLTMERLLAERPEFAGWSVAGCRTRLGGETLRRTVHSSPGQRNARRTAALPEAGRGPEHVRRYALAHASRLRAFGPRMFGLAEGGTAGPECVDAELLAGSLFMGVHLVFDGLYHDLDVLQRIRGTVADLREPWILQELPAAFADRYDITFVRRFLLVAGTGAQRLVEPYWQPPSCFAEALAVRMMFRSAHGYLVEHGLPAGSGYFEELVGNALDPEHLRSLQLFDTGAGTCGDVLDPRGPATWFAAVDDLCSVHPYAADAPAP